jgi:hypothetical protein
MALTQAMCTSFKSELMLAVHDFRPSSNTGASIFKLALYTSSATMDANTTAYAATNEVSSTSTNYTAGGNALTNLGTVAANTSSSAGTGYTNFSNLTFSNANFTARGALIYNTTPKSNSNANTTLVNAAVCVLDFGADKTASNGDFTVLFPSATNTTAIIRVA